MTPIETLVAASVARIELSHAAREQALTAARSLIRQCANTIRAAHRGDFATATQLLAEASTTVGTMRQLLTPHADLLYAGYTQDAFKEYAEAALVCALLAQTPPPSADTLGIPPAAYLNGLAEAASELRRAILDGLRRGETERGEALLAVMDEIYSLLITIDYPDAVTGGLRRTTDALRAVLERTRGDMTTAIRQDRLATALERHYITLNEGNTTNE